MLEFTFSFHYRMEEAYNPWNVTSLEAFHFYNCPECEEKYAIKEHFIGHAMVSHQKARDTLPGILQVQNNIVISNVQSVMEQEICDDVKSDLESSISIEKVEPMSDTETVENDENYDASNIANRSDDTETVENCDTSNTEPVMIKISRKDKNIGDQKVKTRMSVKSTFGIEKKKKYNNHMKYNNMFVIDALTKRIQCKQCEKDYGSKRNFFEHIQSAHEGVTFNCDQCSKTFNTFSGLRRHIQSVHEGVTFKCDHCDKVLTSSNGIRRHKSSHHPKKP